MFYAAAFRVCCLFLQLNREMQKPDGFFLLHSTATAGKVINFNTAGGDFDPKQERLVEVLIYFWKVTMALITPLQV